MLSREATIECYMMNDKKVIAEMLYDTITKYEERLKELEYNMATSIEEIEYALAKPQCANVYLNNAIRFLKDKQ